MSAQLSLLDTPAPELEIVPWGRSRRLPLLKNPAVLPCEGRMRHQPARVVNARGRHVPEVCQPGFHTGRKPGNAGMTYEPQPVTPKDFERIIAATGGGYAGARDRALYAFLWGTGARISEALDLMVHEIDFDEQTVTILKGKNSKQRTLGLNPETAEELQRWLVKRAELGVTDAQPVFCVIAKPTTGKRMYSACVRVQLRDCCRRAGIRKRITPHSFRHGFAVDMVRRGWSIPVISRCLGHANSAITARYIDHVDREEALNAMRTRPTRLEVAA